MGRIWNVDKEEKALVARLQKAIQSVNLNFLIGSGCSSPALGPLGNIEKEIEKRFDEGKEEEGEKMIFGFLTPILEVSTSLEEPEEKTEKTLENYKTFLSMISEILFERKNNILPRQANIFSCNYDLFVEKAFEGVSGLSKLNDGFNRTPLLSNAFIFSPAEFFNSIYNNGNLYNYQVQIPSVNLIKLHGSLTWQMADNEIVFRASDSNALLQESRKLSEASSLSDLKKFNRRFSVVLPTNEKFKSCILNQTYYDLLRIYANELDKENTLLIVEGFSFGDQHITAITKRALKNPSLHMAIFCYKKEELNSYLQKFEDHKNVDIIYSETKDFSFREINLMLKTVLPVANSKQDEPETVKQ